MATNPNTIISYPDALQPLDGTEAYAAWQNGGQKQVTGFQLAKFLLGGIGTPTDQSETAAALYARLAAQSQDAAAIAAAITSFLPSPVSSGGALPFEVLDISGGVGTGSGGSPGEYAMGVTGGPQGHQAFVTIDSTGKIAGYRNANPGISTNSNAPVYSISAVPGLTGATVPTATVGPIPVNRTFYAPSSDGTQVLAWGNNAGALASAPFGGTQLALYGKSTIDTMLTSALAIAYATADKVGVATYVATTIGNPIVNGGSTVGTAGIYVDLQNPFAADGPIYSASGYFPVAGNGQGCFALVSQSGSTFKVEALYPQTGIVTGANTFALTSARVKAGWFRAWVFTPGGAQISYAPANGSNTLYASTSVVVGMTFTAAAGVALLSLAASYGVMQGVLEPRLETAENSIALLNIAAAGAQATSDKVGPAIYTPTSIGNPIIAGGSAIGTPGIYVDLQNPFPVDAPLNSVSAYFASPGNGQGSFALVSVSGSTYKVEALFPQVGIVAGANTFLLSNVRVKPGWFRAWVYPASGANLSYTMNGGSNLSYAVGSVTVGMTFTVAAGVALLSLAASYGAMPGVHEPRIVALENKTSGFVAQDAQLAATNAGGASTFTPGGIAAGLVPGADAPVGAVITKIGWPRVAVSASVAKLVLSHYTRPAANDLTAIPGQVGDTLVETISLTPAQAGLTVGVAGTAIVPLTNPAVIGSDPYHYFVLEGLSSAGARVAFSSAPVLSGVASGPQFTRGWYRSAPGSAYGLANATSGIPMLAYSTSYQAPAVATLTTKASVTACAATASGLTVTIDPTRSMVGKQGAQTAFGGSVTHAAPSSGTVNGVAPEAITLSYSDGSDNFANAPSGSKLAHAGITNLVVTRVSDGAVLVAGTDYVFNAQWGFVALKAAGAAVPVTCTYSWSAVRYDLIYLDRIAGTIGVVQGTEGVRDSAERMPARGSSKRIPLFMVRVFNGAVDLVPRWNVEGYIQRDLRLQWLDDQRRGRKAMRSTMGALRNGKPVEFIFVGDSIIAIQNAAPSVTAPDGAARDRATSSGGFLMTPGAFGADITNAIPLYDNGDGAGQVHTRFGIGWGMVSKLMAGFPAATITVKNFGIAGTDSTNANNGLLQTNRLAAITAEIAAAIAAGKQPCVVVNVGMNERGSTATEGNVSTFLAACYAAGADALVLGCVRPNAYANSDVTWRFTCDALRGAAEYTDPASGKSAAYVDTVALFDDGTNVTGQPAKDLAGDNGYNHPSPSQCAPVSDAAAAIFLEE